MFKVLVVFFGVIALRPSVDMGWVAISSAVQKAIDRSLGIHRFQTLSTHLLQH